MGVIFHPESHTYELDGRRIPSVTQVLQLSGLHDDFSRVPEHIRNHAATRGTYVHEACAHYDAALAANTATHIIGPWLDDLDPALKGYVMGWVRFRIEHALTFTAIEKLVWSPEYGGVAGTLDRATADTVYDIKTGSKVSWNTAYQLAAYAWLYDRIGVPPSAMHRRVVHLKPDATYALMDFPSPDDLDTFVAALRIAHVRLRNGAKLED